jgi:UDP-arabinose 4-epimerase
LQVKGKDYDTPDGTCIRDYIDVTDLVDAHVKALEKAMPKKVGIYNVGTGTGRINRKNNHYAYCIVLSMEDLVEI